MKYIYKKGKSEEVRADFVELIGLDNSGAEKISVKISPDKGCNMFSLKVDGTELLFPAIDYKGHFMMLGVPILYPFPNRMAGAKFSLDGYEYRFTPNSGDLLLHGLITTSPWESSEPEVGEDGISFHNQIVFHDGTDLYQQYPIKQKLELVYKLKEDRVSLTFTVTNQDEIRRLPFGLGIHPYFKLISPRESIKIQVPAKKWMEAENLMPSGKLISLADGPAVMLEPTPLSELDLDDVFWGMVPEESQKILYEEAGLQVTFKATEIFTHTCIFCPPTMPFFCMENQTCSADAHNLYTAGFEKESHLLILEPGKRISGSIEILFSDI